MDIEIKKKNAKTCGDVRLKLIILIQTKNKKYSIDAKFKINKSNMNIWEIQKGVDMKM